MEQYNLSNLAKLNNNLNIIKLNINNLSDSENSETQYTSSLLNIYKNNQVHELDNNFNLMLKNLAKL
jgi:hypothetical protein